MNWYVNCIANQGMLLPYDQKFYYNTGYCVFHNASELFWIHKLLFLNWNCNCTANRSMQALLGLLPPPMNWDCNCTANQGVILSIIWGCKCISQTSAHDLVFLIALHKPFPRCAIVIAIRVCIFIMRFLKWLSNCFHL